MTGSYRTDLTDEDRTKFITKAPSKVPAGTVVISETKTGKKLGIIAVPAGFQIDRWIMSWYTGDWYSRGMRSFDLQDIGVTYTREFDGDKQ